MRYDANGRRHGEGAPATTEGKGTRPPPRDVVFDFSESGRLDHSSLSMLFTARQIMKDRDQRVWITGLPSQFWRYLRSMGLEGWFLELPGTAPGEA